MMSAGVSHPRSRLRVPTGVLMLYKTLSAAVYGIDANIIGVEVDVSGVKMSEDHFHTVGLPDAAVRESRDRVRSALKNCGYDIPLHLPRSPLVCRLPIGLQPIRMRIARVSSCLANLLVPT
jgi:hypothetical protein